MTAIISAFVSGFIIAVLISIRVHRQHKAAWQDEYRRLMAGIHSAWLHIGCEDIPRSEIIKHLKELFKGE